MKICRVAIIVFFCIVSCKRNNNNNDKLAAKVNGIGIQLTEADNYAKYEIYETLQRIYVLRKAATEELINDKLFELEAKRLNVSKEAFFKEHFDDRINDSTLNLYIQLHKLNLVGMPDISNGYKTVYPNTPAGKLMARNVYKRQLMNELLHQLRPKYNTEILLTPPSAPKVNINSIPIVHYSGNLNSSIILLIVSDFTCENCRAAFPEYKKIIGKYAAKVKFGFTHFSSMVSLASVCSEAAGLQNKFWEYHDEIFKKNNLNENDTATFIDMAKKINLDINKFRKDLLSERLRELLNLNLESIKMKRIYATPTLILNGKVILNVHNIAEIEKLLDDEIK